MPEMRSRHGDALYSHRRKTVTAGNGCAANKRAATPCAMRSPTLKGSSGMAKKRSLDEAEQQVRTLRELVESLRSDVRYDVERVEMTLRRAESELNERIRAQKRQLAHDTEEARQRITSVQRRGETRCCRGARAEPVRRRRRRRGCVGGLRTGPCGLGSRSPSASARSARLATARTGCTRRKRHCP